MSWLACSEDVLPAVAQPDRVLRGTVGELLAVRAHPSGLALVVVYREEAMDGFIITAFLTSRLRQRDRREQVWP